MKPHAVEVHAKVYILTRAEGGRTLPVMARGYMPQFNIDGCGLPCRVMDVATDAFESGQSYFILLRVAGPDNFDWERLLRPGAHFEFREGRQTVGKGVIVSVKEAPSLER